MRASIKIPIQIWTLAIVALLFLSGPAMAQRREDILSIQRDVAQLQDQVKQMQLSQDQKMTAIESLLKQSLEQSARVSAAMDALQRNLADRLNEQQSKVVAPIAVL